MRTLTQRYNELKRAYPEVSTSIKQDEGDIQQREHARRVSEFLRSKIAGTTWRGSVEFNGKSTGVSATMTLHREGEAKIKYSVNNKIFDQEWKVTEKGIHIEWIYLGDWDLSGQGELRLSLRHATPELHGSISGSGRNYGNTGSWHFKLQDAP